MLIKFSAGSNMSFKQCSVTFCVSRYERNAAAEQTLLADLVCMCFSNQLHNYEKMSWCSIKSNPTNTGAGNCLLTIIVI